MLGWLLDWLLWLLWWALVCGGWYGWLRARYQVRRLESELTRLAHALRYARRDA